MGRGYWSSLVFFSVVSFSISYQTAKAELVSSAFHLLGPALLGITERSLDNKYTEVTGLDPKATVALTRGSALCTGTFVSPNTLLTAVHCIDAKNPRGGVNVDGINSIMVYFNDLYFKLGESERIRYDVAVVIFPPGTGDFLGIKKYPELASAEPNGGDKIYLVGYGMNNPWAMWHPQANVESGTGIKGWGTANISEAKDGILFTEAVNVENRQPIAADKEKQTAAPNSSRALPGDSGSSAYNEQGRILGITSVVARLPKNVEVVTDLGFIEVPFVKDWEVSNEFADIMSPETEDLFTLAKSNEEVRKRAYFGDAPEAKAKPSKPSLFSRFFSGPFDHVLVRTGTYEKVGKPEIQVYVHPIYRSKVIIALDYAEADGTASPKVQRLGCSGNYCTDKVGSVVIRLEKDRVHHALTKDDPTHVADKIITEETSYQYAD